MLKFLWLLISSIPASYMAVPSIKYGGIRNTMLFNTPFYEFRQTTFSNCHRLCLYAASCSSVSWNSVTHHCHLNLHDGSGQLAAASGFTYLPVAPVPRTNGQPCLSRPCSSDHICAPVKRGRGFVCLRLQPSAPTPFTTATTSTVSTTRMLPTGITDTTTTTPTITTLTTTVATTTTIITTSTATPTSASTTSNYATSTENVPTSVTTEDNTDMTTQEDSNSQVSTEEVSTVSPHDTTVTTDVAVTTDTTDVTTVPNDVTTEEGVETTTVNYTCSTNSDCGDFNNMYCLSNECVCGIGFHFDPFTGQCRDMRECLTLADTVTKFDGQYIAEYNEETLTDKQISECTAICIAATTYTCKTFETMFSKCYLQAVFWLDAPETSRKTSTTFTLVDHYQRDCIWDGST